MHINQTIHGDSSIQLYTYGVHDNYNSGMQKLLETSDKFLNPNFASAYVFELRKDKCDNYFVKVLYKNDKYPGGVTLNPVVIRGILLVS